VCVFFSPENEYLLGKLHAKRQQRLIKIETDIYVNASVLARRLNPAQEVKGN